MKMRPCFALLLAARFSLASAPAVQAAGVVINEVMYHPPRDREGLQYIELFNASTNAVELAGWKFTKGVKFTFPPGTRLDAGAFLVVCRKKDNFVERYGDKVPLAGPFEGKLSHGGERLELRDVAGALVDTVKYSDRAPWPLAADGASPSLERVCPDAPGDDPANWAASNLPRVVAPGGTPGKTNDAHAPNLPPVISAVECSPREPEPGQPVTITATVSDADGIKNVSLLHHLVGATFETNLPMRRGIGHDRKAIYSAELSAPPDGKILRYRIRATDTAGVSRMAPSTNELRPAWTLACFANTNRSRIPHAFLLTGGAEALPDLPSGRGRGSLLSSIGIEAPRGDGTLVLLPPDGGPARVFDHVRITPRKGGYKVHFPPDESLRGMTTVNVIFEAERSALSEHLSFEFFRMAGVPAPLSEHWRVWVNGQPRGWQLVFEQVNKSFLQRHHRDDSGNLYKLLWYGSGVLGQHEKKTHLEDGHDDLIEVLKGLGDTEGDAQWKYIEQHFNVTNFLDYYAVNMCIQNWDGFFNNYWTYHEPRPGGGARWEIYPWDEDKTWGDHDGGDSIFTWFTMPLTIGMNGDRPPGGRGGFGRRGGASWWRAPGWFSGPLLANPEFRQRFRARLREVTETYFTPEKMNPLINALEKKLEPEIHPDVLPRFRREVESFRAQVIGRRKFILEELEKGEQQGGAKATSTAP